MEKARSFVKKLKGKRVSKKGRDRSCSGSLPRLNFEESSHAVECAEATESPKPKSGKGVKKRLKKLQLSKVLRRLLLLLSVDKRRQSFDELIMSDKSKTVLKVSRCV